MTEQPPPSAEALAAAAYALPIMWGDQLVHDVAVAFDRFAERVCEQRVSAETERCARIAVNCGSGIHGQFIAVQIRAPAERPAPAKTEWMVDPPRGSEWQMRVFDSKHAADIYAAACPPHTRIVERPAPPQQPIIAERLTLSAEQSEYLADLRRRETDYDPSTIIGGPRQKDSLRGVGVEQPTQETDRLGCGNRWLPIDSAPKDGSLIIISDGDVPAVGLWREADQKWIVEWDREPFEGPEPSIWCPLPNDNVVPSALASTGEQPDKEEDFGEGSV